MVLFTGDLLFSFPLKKAQTFFILDIMLLSYKFRLYPSKKEEYKLSCIINMCRFVYNKFLENLNNQSKPDKAKLQSLLPSLKEEFPELKEVYAKVLQFEVHRLFSNLNSLSKLKKRGKKLED